MPVRSDGPLRKVTLNLYESDCQWFEKNYGRGWTERLRQHVHNVITSRQPEPPALNRPMTLGDLANE